MKASVRDLTEAERAHMDGDQVARKNLEAAEEMLAAADTRPITVAQLRAAFKAWEADVRENRGAFAAEEECRTAPLDEQADDCVATILRYVRRAELTEQSKRSVAATGLSAAMVNDWQRDIAVS